MGYPLEHSKAQYALLEPTKAASLSRSNGRFPGALLVQGDLVQPLNVDEVK